MKKLNLGCGKDYKKGWVNVDADKSVKADLYFDVAKKFPLKDSSFNYILAQDLIEHLTKEQSETFFKECYRILKPKGRLKLRFPNLFDIFKRFRKDPEVLFNFVYGNTHTHQLFGLHKWGYTKETLKKTLARHGFKLLWIKEKETNFEAEAEKVKLPKTFPKLVISGLDSGGFGGAEKFLTDLAKQLKKNKVTVTFLTLRNSHFEKYLKSQNLKTISFNYRIDLSGNFKGLIKSLALLSLNFYLYLKTLKALKNKGYKILLISGFSDKILLTPAAKFLKLKVIWIEFAPLDFIFQKLFYLPKIFYRIVKNLPDVVVIPTYYAKGKLIPQTRISEAKMGVIPCGIKILNQRQRLKYQKKAYLLKKKLNLENAFVIGQVSRLQKEKGQSLLFQASAIAKKKIPNLKVVIVGEGDQQKDLQELAKKLKIQKDVLFLGFWKDVYEALSLMDIFIFPSFWKGEGFGLAPLEAINLNLPVIAFNLPPMNEVLENSAYFCEPNPKSLAKAIIELYKNKKLKKDLIQKSFANLKKYDIKKVANNYLKIAKELNNQLFILNKP